MDKSVCDERHNQINYRLNIHEERLNNHGQRIDQLEQYKSKTEAQINNLCDQIKSLVTTMRWFIGLLVGAFISFFFYAVQKGLFN